MQSQYKLILASASPRRQQLIRLLNIPVQICPADVDEQADSSWSPQETVEQLSLRKAQHVRDQTGRDDDTIIVGSDTIVYMDGMQLGKPKDEQHAIQMLHRLQGRQHQVYSGVACVHAASGEIQVAHRMTKVYMLPMNERQIKAYVNTGEPLDKAGAYAIQGSGALFVERIEGCYFNVVGLPISLLAELLTTYGWNVL